MFERYTEKARRVIFFGRHEASQLGCREITPEHLLLAMFREEPGLLSELAPALTREQTRSAIDKHLPPGPQIPTPGDMPLSQASKIVLAYAAEEAGRLEHHHIGPEHLFLGIAREEKSTAAKLLREHGFDLEKARSEVTRIPPPNDWQKRTGV